MHFFKNEKNNPAQDYSPPLLRRLSAKDMGQMGAPTPQLPTPSPSPPPPLLAPISPPHQDTNSHLSPQELTPQTPFHPITPSTCHLRPPRCNLWAWFTHIPSYPTSSLSFVPQFAFSSLHNWYHFSCVCWSALGVVD
jgi:hypothetical protein